MQTRGYTLLRMHPQWTLQLTVCAAITLKYLPLLRYCTSKDYALPCVSDADLA